MATVYAPPAHFPDPPPFEDFTEDGYDFEAHRAAEEQWIEDLAALARTTNKGDLVGEVISFGVADGAAQYLIWKHKPFQLIHLAVGDAYSIPTEHARGLRLADARRQVEGGKRLAELFRAKTDWFDTQPVGGLLHYHNSGGAFVRGEVVEVGGQKAFRSLHLVGAWREHDLPRRNTWNGEIGYSTGGNFLGIGHSDLRGGPMEPKTWRPDSSVIFESPDFMVNENWPCTDPRVAPAIDVTISDPTEEELETHRLYAVRDQVTAALNAGPDEIAAALGDALDILLDAGLDRVGG